MPCPERHVIILGSTGSIGTQTIDIIERLNQRGYAFSVVGLAAGRNVERLAEQIKCYRPRAVCVEGESEGEILRQRFPEVRVFTGEKGLRELARLDEVDLIVNALVGAIGLPPTLDGLFLGRTVALANKESLVVGGELVTKFLSEYGGAILPIDSEHNALFQCLRAGRLSEVRRVILTASGGPFLHVHKEALDQMRPEEALCHPNWAMGSRITIDSATMVNKGFEVIEAHFLFHLPYERISVIIHPDSVIHSFVEYHDGSLLAELASPDMRIPIQYALTYPKRVETGLPRLNLEEISRMEFEPLDHEHFPAFATVLKAAKQGGTSPAVINAVDEVLVERFLEGEIPFTGIASGLQTILSRWESAEADLKEISSDAGNQDEVILSTLLAADRWARKEARYLSF